MEEYKRTLKCRMVLLGLLAAACCVLLGYSLSGAAAHRLPDFQRGFQTGVACGMGGVSVVWVVWYVWVLRDPKRLRLQYNKEMDERMKAISAKAGMPMIWVTSVLMILAGMVGGYWHSMVFYTLVAAGTFQLIAAKAVVLVYCKLM